MHARLHHTTIAFMYRATVGLAAVVVRVSVRGTQMEVQVDVAAELSLGSHAMVAVMAVRGNPQAVEGVFGRLAVFVVVKLMSCVKRPGSRDGLVATRASRTNAPSPAPAAAAWA